MRSIESIIHANSLLWAREHLRVEDLPTFKELLQEVDPVTLARVVVDCHGGKDMEKGTSEYLSELAKVLGGIEDMRQLDEPYAGEETVFVPKAYFSKECRHTIWYSLSLSRLRWADIPAVLEQAERVSYSATAAEANKRELFCYPRSFHTLDNNTCPWEEILAARVWLGGDRVSTADRYEMLGSVIFSMTILGSTHEEFERYRRALEELEPAMRQEPVMEYRESELKLPPSGLGPYGLGLLDTQVEFWDMWTTHNHFSDTLDLLQHNAWVHFYRGVQEMASHFDEFIQEAPADEGGEGAEGEAPSATEAAAGFMDEYETVFEELAEGEGGEGCTA